MKNTEKSKSKNEITRTTETAKWFVSDISVHEAYGTLAILPGDPELSHVSHIPRNIYHLGRPA
jgi:hypothetical protein